MHDTSRLRGRPTPPPATRAELLDPASLDPAQRALYDRITQGPRRSQQGQVPIVDAEGRLLGPFGLMLLTPGIGEAVQELGAALRFRGKLTARCRELAILAVAVDARSHFEWWAHERAGLAAGLGVDQLQQLLDGEVPGDLDEQEESCLRVAVELRRTGRLTDGAYQRAESALGRDGLAELVWLVGYYGTLALALEVFGPPAPEGG